MNEIGRRPKNELIAEIEKLRNELSTMERVIKVNSRLSGVIDESKLFSMFSVPEVDEVWMITDTGRIVYVNNLAAERLGYTLEEIQRLSISQIDPLYPRGKWLHVVNTLKRGQKAEVFQTKHVARDGMVLEKEITAQYLLYEGRYYVIGVGRVTASHVRQSDEKTEDTVEVLVTETDISRESIVLNSVTEGVMYVDTTGAIIEINPSAAKMFGYTKNEILGRNYLDPRWRFFDQNDEPVKISEHPLAVALVAEVPVSSKPVSIITSEGSMRSLLVSATPVFDEKKRLTGAVATLHVKEEPKTAVSVPAESHDRARHDATPIQAMAEVVMKSRSLDELERKVCELLTGKMGFALAWVGTIRAQDPRVHQSTATGQAQEYLMKIKVKYDESEQGRGPIGRCIREQEPQIVGDIQADLEQETWRKQAAKFSLASMACFPILIDGSVQRVLSVYSTTRSYFTPETYLTVRRCAELFAFGAQAIVDRDARVMKEARAREVETLLATMMDAMPVGICQFDARAPYRCTWHNAAYRILLDDPFRKDGVLHATLADFQLSHLQPDLSTQLASVAETRLPVSDPQAVWKDWEGRDTHWHWMVVPVLRDEQVDSLLHIAIPHDSPAEERTDRHLLPSVSIDSTPRGDVSAPPSLPSPESASTHPDVGALFDLMQEGLMAIDAPMLAPRARKDKKAITLSSEGRIVSCNSQGAALLERSRPEDLIGHSIGECLEDPEFLDLLLDALSSKTREAAMTRTQSDDKGRVRILRYRVVADTSAEDRTRFWVVLTVLS